MLDKVINASTCSSSFYCPPSTLVPVTRELAGHSYTFLQVRQRERGYSRQEESGGGRGVKGGVGGELLPEQQRVCHCQSMDVHE